MRAVKATMISIRKSKASIYQDNKSNNYQAPSNKQTRPTWPLTLLFNPHTSLQASKSSEYWWDRAQPTHKILFTTKTIKPQNSGSSRRKGLANRIEIILLLWRFTKSSVGTCRHECSAPR